MHAYICHTMLTYVRTYTHAYIHIRAYIRTNICTYITNIHTHIRACMSVCVCVCVCVCMHLRSQPAVACPLPPPFRTSPELSCASPPAAGIPRRSEKRRNRNKILRNCGREGWRESERARKGDNEKCRDAHAGIRDDSGLRVQGIGFYMSVSGRVEGFGFRV